MEETTPIQTGRKGTDAEWAGPSPMCGRQKFGRDISWARSPRPTPGSPAQGYNARKFLQLLATKIRQDWFSGRNCWSPKQFLLKNANTDSPTQTHSLSSSTGVAARKAQMTQSGKLKCLASRWAEAIVPFLNAPPIEPASWCHIWDSINLASTI